MTSDSSKPPALGPLLQAIQSPDDVKKIADAELPDLAAEIRHSLITSLSQTGGHLGPNLGVVELSIALHRVFSTPKDKFVFDVAHQGYVHKMLTGRADRIHTIRTYKGLNGFLLRSESEHDAYGAGHAGTALSAALGMAAARDLAGRDNHVVAVAGDAAFTCGPTLEALNNIAETTRRFIVVLNDNEWSIDKNVGAIARYFNALQTHHTYASVRAKAADFVEKIAGKTARSLAHRMEEGAKNLLFPNVLFEKFGLRYFGPIDGHDIPLLIRTFEHLKTLNEPVVLHIITEKGRGYQPALDNPGKFHGLGTYQIDDGSTAAVNTPTCSDLFGRTVTDIAKNDQKLVAITAAMPGGTKLEIFKKEVPERYYDVSIAEEHAAYDIGPSAIRYPRGPIRGTSVKEQRQLLEIGKAEVAADGTDVALIGLGTMFEMAERTKELLEAQGLSVALINPRFIKPLDTAVLETYARKCRVLCTFEDHVMLHGFGAAVIDHLHDAGIHTPVERIAWPDEFIEHGKPDTLRELHGLSAEVATSKVLARLA